MQGGAERISIVINVEEPLEERRVWTHQFAGVPKDLLTLQDQIFNGLVEALEVTPSAEAQARGVSRPTNNIEAYDLYLKGRNAMRGQQDKRNVEAAVKLYEDALRIDPRFALAFAGLADASVQMYGETKERIWADKAIAASQQGMRLDENLIEVRIAAASAVLATGKFNEAIVQLQQALRLAPNSDDAYRRLAVAFRRAGRVDDARRMNEEAIRVNPYHWLNHNAMGETALRVGDNARAEQAFSNVIELEPDNVNGLNNLGAIYLMTGRYAQAAGAFQRATELVPTAEAYSNLGIAYAWQGRFQEALPAYSKAVETSPNVDGWLSNLGDGYRWLGQSQKATETYDRAIALAYNALQVNPSDARTRSYLGTYYAKKGDTAQGIKLVREAATADPNEVSILYNVAVVHALAAHPGPALEALGKALKTGYPCRFAQDDPDLKVLSKDRHFETLMKEFQPARSQ